MKILFALIMSVSYLMAGSVPVKEDPVSSMVIGSFNNSFPNAEEVQWSVSRDYYKVQFLLNCQHVFAFYAKDGAMIATTRNMLFTELPLILQTSLKELQNGYWISELFELSNAEGTNYYITLENAGTKLIMRSSRTEWELYQKKVKP